MTSLRFALPLVVAAAAAGCGDSLPSYGDAPKPPVAPPVEPEAPAGSAVGKDPQGPDVYTVRFDTTEGPVVIEVRREWGAGADRFHRLVKDGYYDGAKFFRVVDGFVAQFGMAADPAVNAKWDQARIQDDPVRESNLPGYVTFATSGEDSRTAQAFINLANNSRLDGSGFAPFGKVVEGMAAVEKFHKGYGEAPDQGAIKQAGNAYLDDEFPELDGIKTAKVVSENGVPVAATEKAPATGEDETPRTGE